MGNEILKKSKKLSLEDQKITNFISKSYKDTNLEFTLSEIKSFKLKISDAEKYFFTTFNFFFTYSTSLFHDYFSQLYDNFSHTVEYFCKSHPLSLFFVLISIEDESELLTLGYKAEFEPLFTIIFEKFDLDLLLYIDFTQSPPFYIREFFKQLCENTCLYKFNRKFDCVSFLLPNTDYIIKNGCSVSYLSTSSHAAEPREMIKIAINVKHFKKFLQKEYEVTASNNELLTLIDKVKSALSAHFLYMNFNCKVDDFMYVNELQFRLFDKVISTSKRKYFGIFINEHSGLLRDNLNLLIDKVIAMYEVFEKSNGGVKLKVFLGNCNDNFNVCIVFNELRGKIEKVFKDKKKPKRSVFILELYTIKGEDFVVLISMFQYGEEELISPSSIVTRHRMSVEYEEMEKIFKLQYTKMYKNKKIMQLIKDFLCEKKILITKEEESESEFENEILCVIKRIEGKTKMKVFKKEFLNIF